jgi:hypothetical protein
MKLKVIILTFCLVIGKISAKQVITGKITDKESSKPVEMATVKLLQLPDSSFVEGTITDTEGMFMLYKADTLKKYCLKTSMVNYKSAISAVPVKRVDRVNAVGNIVLEPSFVNIKEVVVNGSKISVTELPDRTTYAIPIDIKKTSTDGLDVLRKVPSIQVDYFNESITVEGKTNIKIEVDGVARNKEYLKKLHPSQIDKLEKITSPSGKYDAEVDAVINIITIKEMRYGLKGMVNTQLFPRAKDTYMGRFNGSLDYGLEKISYYIATNGNVQNFGSGSEFERHQGLTALTTNGDIRSKTAGANINGGLIYDPSPFNNLNINVSYNKNGSEGSSVAATENRTNDVLDKSFVNNGRTTSNSDGINANLFFKHKFDKTTQHAYEVEASYYNTLHNKSSNEYWYQYSIPIISDVNNPKTLEENKTDKQNANIQTNYTLPFDSVYTFNTGIGGYWNHFFVENSRFVNSVLSASASPDLNFKELRGSMFMEFSRTFKTGNLKLGTRVEASHININADQVNDFYSVLPYANGQYKLNDKISLKLNYSRRVMRPSSGQLNPFVSLADSQVVVSHGNIHLVPAYRDRFQLTYSMKYGKSLFSGNISPQVYYEYKSKLIQQIIRPMADNPKRFENTPENISNGYETGFGVSLNAQLFVVMFNSYFGYSNNHINGYLDQIETTNRQSWNSNSYVMCPLPMNFRLFAVLNINSPVLSGQTLTKPSPFYLFGMVKQFKNNGSLNITVLNPFAANPFENTTTINNSNFTQRTETNLKVRNAIMISYSYNFKVGKNINAQKRNIEQGGEESVKQLPF